MYESQLYKSDILVQQLLLDQISVWNMNSHHLIFSIFPDLESGNWSPVVDKTMSVIILQLLCAITVISISKFSTSTKILSCQQNQIICLCGF